MAITIYANWTGNALVTGETFDEAYAKLNEGHCRPSTPLGAGVVDLTALDTGPHPVFTGEFSSLYRARECFPEATVPAALRAGG